MKIVLAGENSIIIYFGDKISPNLPEKIAQTMQQLKTELADLILDLIPSYTSLLVSYELNLISHQDFCYKVEQSLKNIKNPHNQTTPKLIRIPVHYSFKTGLDLERLLAEKNLDLATFIKIHTAREYLVYAIGFSPNFAFLGEVDKRIQAPRLATPRISIPAGSVGIANSQTAIYPTDSSGGWNIIGRTPLDLSLKVAENINKFSVGDCVKFFSITQQDYDKRRL